LFFKELLSDRPKDGLGPTQTARLIC
jgi:hypothetical protein